MRRLLLIGATMLTACGGAAYREAPPASPGWSGADEAVAEATAPEPPAQFIEAEYASRSTADAAPRAPSTLAGGPARGRSEPPPPPKAEEPRAPAAEPLVVYFGHLRLRVKRLLAAVDAITAVTEKAGGYVESLTQRVVVVRVPRGDFEATMSAFAALGTVLERRVKALDVTQQFTDLQSRLAVARGTRDRLLVLLQQTTDPEERRRILQEVKRLTEQIESMDSTLATLRNLVDFYTITIQLEPVLDTGGAVAHRSPFAWVRGLEPHLQTITEGNGEFRLQPPADFVLFDEDDAWRAQSADTAMVRAGTVENDPVGDGAYWAAALDHEMEGRDEERVGEGQAGAMAWRVYRNKDLEPRWYLVAVHAEGEKVFVVEAFYPNQGAFERHHGAVLKALETFGVE